MVPLMLKEKPVWVAAAEVAEESRLSVAEGEAVPLPACTACHSKRGSTTAWVEELYPEVYSFSSCESKPPEAVRREVAAEVQVGPPEVRPSRLEAAGREVEPTTDPPFGETLHFDRPERGL